MCVYVFGGQFTVYAREVVKGAQVYVVHSNDHVTFWPQQTGRRRSMIASIGNVPGDTKPFDFGNSHCTMLRMDNKVDQSLKLKWKKFKNLDFSKKNFRFEVYFGFQKAFKRFLRFYFGSVCNERRAQNYDQRKTCYTLSYECTT